MSATPRAGRPRVTVVVVTYNSADVVGDCLRSIPAAFAGVSAPDIVVADNASADGTVGAVKDAAPEAVFFRLASNQGYAAAINAGLAAAPAGPGDAVLILNPDIRLEPGSMAPLLTALAEPGVGIVVPHLVDEDGRTQLSLRREPTVLRTTGEAVLGGIRAGRFAPLGEVITDPEAYQRPAEVDWATGAAMLVSAACLRAVGRWEESWFLFSEEVDFALRARDAGFSVRYEPRARAVHLSGSSSTNPELWPLVVRNKLRLYRRRHGPIRSAGFTAATVVNEALRAAAGRQPSRAALRSILRPGPEPRMPRRATSPAEDHPAGDGVICFSAQDWWYFNRAHSDFQLLTRVATEQPVLLVNSLGMRLPLPGRSTQPFARVARKLASLTKGLRHPLPDTPGFAVLTPLFLPVYHAGRARDLSNRFVTWQVRRAANRLGIHDPTVVVTLPTAWEAARNLPRRALVANRSDRYSAFGEADGSWVAGLERDLLSHADVAVYASRSLLEAESHLTANPVFLDHGVDLERFLAATELSESPDLAGIAHPRLGFFGAVDDYTVDLGLLHRLAIEIPEAQVVLVGPSNCSLDALLDHPNVHWLGACQPHEVPAYGAGFDVALMPWLDNEWITHCNPIKVKEYLALGLPVVTTAFPEVDRYRDLLRIARSTDEFVALVRQTVLDGGPATPARRRAAVADDGWDRRAADLVDLVALRPEEGTCAAS